MTDAKVSFVLEPNTFEVNPKKIDELMGLTGPSQTTREDTYSEYADIEPVTIRNAGLLLREAQEVCVKAAAVKTQYVDLLKRADDVLAKARKEMSRAEYRLKISALQPNGGEE